MVVARAIATVFFEQLADRTEALRVVDQDHGQHVVFALLTSVIEQLAEAVSFVLPLQLQGDLDRIRVNTRAPSPAAQCARSVRHGASPFGPLHELMFSAPVIGLLPRDAGVADVSARRGHNSASRPLPCFERESRGP